MTVEKAYDEWSGTYDAVANPTRDLEQRVCETVLSAVEFSSVLEIGSGTGKNTEWLGDRADRVMSVDLSKEMQAIAKTKVKNRNVDFRIADIQKDWTFAAPGSFDLVTCSLVLEHVRELGGIFQQAKGRLAASGRFYICELHPFKQYSGSKARFESPDGTQAVECFIHNLTDYLEAAAAHGFTAKRIDEWFDNDNRTQIPRLKSFLFQLD
jgi:malonyl-CoA O-methyltransferase